MSEKMSASFLQYRSAKVVSLERRLFLRQGLSLGALALLSGCDLTGGESVQKVLSAMSRWNDGVQDWLFAGSRRSFPKAGSPRPSRSTPTTAKRKS